MEHRRGDTNAKEVFILAVLAIRHIDKGAKQAIELIEALASTLAVAYASKMLLASLIRGSP